MCSFGLLAASASWAGNLVVQEIRPSDADPSISRFDEPNYVVFEDDVAPAAPLVVFMPGTDGRPANASRLLGVVAHLGYRVIGLEYNDDPAVVQVCPQNASPECSGNFRQRRIFGGEVKSVVENTQSETIVNRLVTLLQYLDAHDAAAGWGRYLEDGAPRWSQIVVSGLSQGAGMAAYIAKQKSVARVVLFSSPWDFQRASRRLAPWLLTPSATAPELWYAEYHRRENTAAMIKQAYQVLGIPPDHIRVFDLDLPAGYKVHSDNPYHGSTIRVPGYEPEWEFLFGRPP